ncbi:MAG TPA: CDP-alcohol phosphatidyltransferase family protein [Mollicutes bacterium]|nr:CDP-alcohol phosphatidyltransferase family protein [Mollicutes bacterium]
MNNKSKIIVNSVTLIRLFGTLFIPVVNYYFSIEVLITYLIILLLTDALDGFLARKLNASTLFGSLLDTATDKLLAIAALAVLSKNYLIMLLPIFTEGLIMIINMFGAIKGAITESSPLGKFKTWVLGIAIVVGFLTIFSSTLIRSTEVVLYVKAYDYLIVNADNIMNILASITVGAGLIVAFDYYNQIKKDLKSSEEFKLRQIRLKEKKDLRHALFDTKYYESTRSEPLIKKIGVINSEKISPK